jgi:hypothetical protein
MSERVRELKSPKVSKSQSFGNIKGTLDKQVYSFTFNKSDSVENNKNKFLMYTSYTHCNCESSCITTTIQNVKQSKNCNEIIIFNQDENFSLSINNIIDFFKYLKVLVVKDSSFYIDTEEGLMKFSWKNIKKIKNNEMRMLLWMFRKAIIDCILKEITQAQIYNGVKIYSVGSTKLDSDYDLTLYGDTFHISTIISRFKLRFFSLFKTNSSVAFDTNLYGTGFINYNKASNSNLMFACGEETFGYLQKSDSYTHSQFVWALLHYYSILQSTYDPDIAELIFNELSTVKHCIIAKKLYEYINNQDLSYYSLLHNPQVLSNFRELYTDDLLRITDYISLTNVFADEAYYTRGAFMDTVVNMQMCKGSDTKVLLDVHDYVNSIIENTAFFISHQKVKYITRVKNAIMLSGINSSYVDALDNVVNLTAFEDSVENVLTKYCNNTNTCIHVLHSILQDYYVTLDTTDINVPFQQLSDNGIFLSDYLPIKTKKDRL